MKKSLQRLNLSYFNYHFLDMNFCARCSWRENDRAQIPALSHEPRRDPGARRLIPCHFSLLLTSHGASALQMPSLASRQTEEIKQRPLFSTLRRRICVGAFVSRIRTHSTFSSCFHTLAVKRRSPYVCPSFAHVRNRSSDRLHTWRACCRGPEGERRRV